MKKPIVVISAVNLTQGGPLSILQDAVYCFVENFISEYQLILLVHRRNLVEAFLKNKKVTVIEYTYPKMSWFLRICFEYVHCYFISKKVKPFLWLALHDMTPNAITENKIVYCHNPAPFYKLTWKEAMAEKSLIFFKIFYNLFYRLNIRSNKYVIVQQQWMREEFQNRYKIKNIIVSYPDVPINNEVEKKNYAGEKIYSFLYPSWPRAFKNFETVLESTEFLENQSYKFEVILTFDGSENKYASQLKKKYGQMKSVKFIGFQKRVNLLKLYSETSCLVFASKMETWGLPITEMKLFNKPMLLADSKYAHETVANYHKACFFESDNPVQLGELMKKAIKGTLEFHTGEFMWPQPPFTKTWKELFSLILT